jgi:hypothetical protein
VFALVVSRLGCLRGVWTLTGFGLAVELGAGPAARDRGERANRRLHARWAGFDTRRKLPVVANTAIARELAGWCWSLAVLDD